MFVHHTAVDILKTEGDLALASRQLRRDGEKAAETSIEASVAWVGDRAWCTDSPTDEAGSVKPATSPAAAWCPLADAPRALTASAAAPFSRSWRSIRNEVLLPRVRGASPACTEPVLLSSSQC